MNTKQKDVPQARKRMMKEIFIGKLIDTSEESLEDLVIKSSFAKAKRSDQQKFVIKNTRQEKMRNIDQKAPLRNVTTEKQVPTSEENKRKKIKWPKSNSKEWEMLDFCHMF